MDVASGATAIRTHGDAGPPGAALPWIDWMRFLAALEVFLFHLRGSVFEPYDQFAPAHKNVVVIGWFAITHFGGEAVLFFFVLSGYLVGGGLIERVRAGSFRPRDYAIDRATRMLVPFVPALAAAVALQFFKNESVSAAGIVGNLASLQGVLVEPYPYIGVDWSLAYEFWFYILGGALAACLLAPRWRPFAIAFAAAGFLVFCVLDRDLLFCWMLGALASQIELKQMRPAWLLFGAVLTSVGLFLANELFAGFRAHFFSSSTINVSLTRLMITIGMLIVLRNLVMLRPRSPVARRLDALGTRLAAFSYSLYLVHALLLAFCVHLGMPTQQDMTTRSLAQYGGYIVFIPLTAYAFYWLFERHTNAVRRFLKRRLPGA